MFVTLPACLRGEPVFMSETLYKTIKGFMSGPPLSQPCTSDQQYLDI